MPWYCWFVLLGEAGSGQAGDRNLICFVLCHDGSRWSGGGWAAAGGEQIWIYFQIMPDGSLVKFTQTRMRSTWWEIYLKKTFYFLFCFLSSMHCIWERSKKNILASNSKTDATKPKNKLLCFNLNWIAKVVCAGLAESLHLRPIARSKSGQHNQTMDRDASLFITSLFTINAFSFYSWQNILCRAPRSRF